MATVDKRLLYIIFLVATVVLSVSAGFYYGVATIASNRNIQTLSFLGPCTYIVYPSGGNYNGRNCRTGEADQVSSNFATELGIVIGAMPSGGIIHLLQGTYSLSSAVSSNRNDIVLEGEGRATIIRLTSTAASHVFTISGSNWVVKNLLLDMNGELGTTNGYDGFSFTGNNEIVSGTYIENGNFCAIMFSGNNNLATGNTVVGMANNGICTGGNNASGPSKNANTVFSNNLVLVPNAAGAAYLFEYTQNATAVGNIARGGNQAINCAGSASQIVASQNILLDTIGGGGEIGVQSNVGHDFTFSDNTMIGSTGATGNFVYVGSGDYNVNIDGNHGSQATGDGIETHGYQIDISNNVLSSTGAPAIDIIGGYDVNIQRNIISQVSSAASLRLEGGAYQVSIQSNIFAQISKEAIYIASPSHDFSISDNMINGTGGTRNGIYIDAGVRSFTIQRNRISSINTNWSSIDLNGDNSNFQITGNFIREVGTPNFDALYASTPSNYTITGNEFIGLGILGKNQWESAIVVTGNSGSGLISNNYFLGDMQSGIYLETGAHNVSVNYNVFQTMSTGVTLSGTPIYNAITHNQFLDVINPISIGSRDKDNHTLIMFNVGYNPIGKITSFLFTGGTSQPEDGNWISPFGTSSSLSPSTTYTITTAPCRITFQTTGRGVTVSIDRGTGFSPTIGESFLLYPGETISFGGYSNAPVLQVNFI